jgi:hypothetical protein
LNRSISDLRKTSWVRFPLVSTFECMQAAFGDELVHALTGYAN